jgi:hypothetical protein
MLPLDNLIHYGKRCLKYGKSHARMALNDDGAVIMSLISMMTLCINV